MWPDMMEKGILDCKRSLRRWKRGCWIVIVKDFEGMKKGFYIIKSLK